MYRFLGFILICLTAAESFAMRGSDEDWLSGTESSPSSLSADSALSSPAHDELEVGKASGKRKAEEGGEPSKKAKADEGYAYVKDVDFVEPTDGETVSFSGSYDLSNGELVEPILGSYKLTSETDQLKAVFKILETDTVPYVYDLKITGRESIIRDVYDAQGYFEIPEEKRHPVTDGYITSLLGREIVYSLLGGRRGRSEIILALDLKDKENLAFKKYLDAKAAEVEAEKGGPVEGKSTWFQMQVRQKESSGANIYYHINLKALKEALGF